MSSKQCEGQTVIVTGSAGGLGKDIAKAFLEAGANVTICDVNGARLASAEKELKAAHRDRLLAVQTDVADEASVSDLVAQTTSRFGRLDVLVNNAGIMDRFDPVGTLSRETWDRVLAVNLTGPFLCSKAAVNQMQAQREKEKDTAAQKGGVIINIGSIASVRGMSAGVAYTVSKHGIAGLTKNTAGMYADQGIYTVALLLGAMDDTNIADSLAKDLNKEAMMKSFDSQPAYRKGIDNVLTGDVGRYCVFLSDRGMAASSNGSCITFSKNWPVA